MQASSPLKPQDGPIQPYILHDVKSRGRQMQHLQRDRQAQTAHAAKANTPWHYLHSPPGNVQTLGSVARQSSSAPRPVLMVLQACLDLAAHDALRLSRVAFRTDDYRPRCLNGCSCL